MNGFVWVGYEPVCSSHIYHHPCGTATTNYIEGRAGGELAFTLLLEPGGSIDTLYAVAATMMQTLLAKRMVSDPARENTPDYDLIAPKGALYLSNLQHYFRTQKARIAETLRTDPDYIRDLNWAAGHFLAPDDRALRVEALTELAYWYAPDLDHPPKTNVNAEKWGKSVRLLEEMAKAENGSAS